MQDKIDGRLVELGIEVNGVLRTYENLNIVASGMKYDNSNQNECTVQISNLDKDVQNQIMRDTSPFNANPTPKLVRLQAGRESIGKRLIFVGDVVNSSISQPPDTTISL